MAKKFEKVRKWFVAEWPRFNEHFEPIILSQGFSIREKADTECEAIREMPENMGKFIIVCVREVKVEIEPLPKWYSNLPDYEVKQSRIFEAYAEYANAKEWW